MLQVERKGNVARGATLDARSIGVRLAQSGLDVVDQRHLADSATLGALERYARNIENMIGTIKVPLGIAGPLRVNGDAAAGDYYVPLATTEATLVASYSRGAQMITDAGGANVHIVAQAQTRAPAFIFDALCDAMTFARWIDANADVLREVAARTTRHGSLRTLTPIVEANYVFVMCAYTTGEAAGQNMVTIATDAVCTYIGEHAPVIPRRIFIEANASGDKKAAAQTLHGVRGRRVCAEVTLGADLVRDRLHTTPADLAEYARVSTAGAAISGCIGVNGQYANGLAALYLACGQDVACVAESAVGISRLECTARGDLYATVTLPNIVVGSLGGGTHLPTQRAALRILDLPDHGAANALAEICAAVCLAGELSIAGAICAAEFSAAHARFARGR